MKVFISYSRKDIQTAKNIERKLSQRGVSVWLDNKSLSAGSIWREEISNGISDCDFFLLLLSENSIKSDNVRKEVDIAESHKKHFVPLLLEEITIPPSLQYQLAGLQYIYFEENLDLLSNKILSQETRHDIVANDKTRDSGMINKRDLWEVINRAFSLEELRVLCSVLEDVLRNDGIDMSVDLDALGGETKLSKILNLIGYLERRGYLKYLWDVVQEERPNIMSTVRSNNL